MSLALPMDSSQRQRASACWAFSMSVHGLFVGLAVLFLTEMPPPPPPTFKWDVAVVQPAPPAADPAPPPPVESQPPPTPQPVTAPKPKQVPVTKAEPVVRQVQQIQERQPVQQVQPVQETVPVRTAQAIQQVTTQRTETVTREAQEAVTPVTEVVQQEVVEQSAPAVEEVSPSQPVTTAEPIIRQTEAVAEVAAVMNETPAVESVPAPVEAIEQVRQEIVQRPVESVQQRVVKHRAVQARPEAQADFGWLGQEIWSSVDQRKRYPAEAKRNHWQGRVILRLTIEQQGAAVHLLDLSLEKSSGHSVLDRHTLEMVRNAFPLKVKHEMAKSKIQLDVPFSYHME